jgi:hypothetical protein
MLSVLWSVFPTRTLRPEKDDLPEEMTIWIEKSDKLAGKSRSRMDPYLLPWHIPVHEEMTVIYSVAELDQQEPASSFTFVAPSDPKLVAEFP